ncbi:MAG: hypothetical protein JXA37_13695 [Chloroflexia bacterium]|nr:hypothetical protein [Chloroflexia bacterium]
MKQTEELPGRWLELRLYAARAGLGPALGWLGGAFASGGPLAFWPHTGHLLLGLFVCSALWGRLWTISAWMPNLRPPAPRPQRAKPAPKLPYTVPGSLSAQWSQWLGRLWRDLQTMGGEQRRWLVETALLAALLLLLAALWGLPALLAGLAGLALLALNGLLRERPAARFLLRALGGLAWPWWLGHAAWKPLSLESLLLSLLWGLAYAAWADLHDEITTAQQAGAVSGLNHPLLRRCLLQADLAQGAVLTFFLLAGRPLVGAALAFALLAQGLLQAGLLRGRQWTALARRTWPFAAAGLILGGMVLGGWL